MEDLVTIIVPTYNRPSELGRLLSFQTKFAEKLKIIVLDGSDDVEGEANSEICQKLENVEYYKFPTSLHLGLRLTEGIKLVKTPFLVVCGDDDFVIPKSVAICAQFLQSNPEYSASMGRVWAMRYYPKRLIVRRGIALGRDLDYGRSYDHEKFIQRASLYFSDTLMGAIPLYYAVRRTEQALRAFSSITNDLKYSSMEVLTNCMLLIDGKVAKLPLTFGMRDYASIPTRDLEREGDNVYIPREDLEYVRPLLVNHLQEVEMLPRQVAEYVINTILLFWTNEDRRGQSGNESKFSTRLHSYLNAAQCVAGQLFPRATSRMLNIPSDVYVRLLQVHQRHTSLRKS